MKFCIARNAERMTRATASIRFQSHSHHRASTINSNLHLCAICAGPSMRLRLFFSTETKPVLDDSMMTMKTMTTTTAKHLPPGEKWKASHKPYLCRESSECRLNMEYAGLRHFPFVFLPSFCCFTDPTFNYLSLLYSTLLFVLPF